MVSGRKKRQSNRRFLSQLYDLDQDIIIGNAASGSQENIVVNKGSKDRDSTIDACRNNIAIIESTVNVTTLERCLNDIVHTVEDKMHNASFTPIEGIVAPKNEL